MPKLEVRFIRHATGTHMGNPELIAGRSHDATLTEQGVEEALQKGGELARRGYVPDLVVASSAVRCMQTAEFVLKGMGIERPIKPTEKLWEMHQGRSEGLPRTWVYGLPEVKARIAAEGRDFALPGGESMRQVGLRGFDWLKEQEPFYSARRKMSIMAIAHRGLITHTIGHLLGWDQPTSLKMLGTIPPMGETRTEFDGRGWQVKAFAEPVQL